MNCNMNLIEVLKNYQTNPNSFSEKINLDGSKEVCDLSTGECYTLREKDGLIERVDNQKFANRKINISTPQGVKQLLNG